MAVLIETKGEDLLDLTQARGRCNPSVRSTQRTNVYNYKHKDTIGHNKYQAAQEK